MSKKGTGRPGLEAALPEILNLEMNPDEGCRVQYEEKVGL